MNYSEEGIKIL